MFQQGKAGLTAKPCDLTWVWREQRSWTVSPCKRLTEAGSAGGALDYLPYGTTTVSFDWSGRFSRRSPSSTTCA